LARHNTMRDGGGGTQPSPTKTVTRHDGLGDGTTAAGSERKAAPITRKISNVTNKLVSPVRGALAKSPELRRRRLPQSSVSSSFGAAAVEGEAGAQAARVSSPSALPPPSDPVLPKMQVFLKDKRLRGLSLSEYCRAIWLEGGDDDDNATTAQPAFFAPWLVSCGKFNICVGHWEEEPHSSPSPSFVNEWDGEAYDRMRTVNFTTKRSGIGPSTADATQIHRLRLEGHDRCIISITVNMNVPFGDSFQVQVRWVVCSVGAPGGVDEISVSVGMLVVFSKSCFVENKIRTNTTNETIKGQTSLFASQERVCRSISIAKGIELQDFKDDRGNGDVIPKIDSANHGICSSANGRNTSIFQSIWSVLLILSGWRLLSYLALGFVGLFGRSGRVVASQDRGGKRGITMEIQAAKEKLEDLEKLLEEQDMTPKQTDSVVAVVQITNDALRKLINKLK
jgi:hypothetical protein